MDTPYDFGDNGLPLPLLSQLPLPLVPLPSSYGSYGVGEYPPLAPDALEQQVYISSQPMRGTIQNSSLKMYVPTVPNLHTCISLTRSSPCH